MERAKKESVAWPLATEYVTGERDNGFWLEWWFNSSNFIESTDKNEKDDLELKIVSFDSDPNDITDMKGVPEFLQLVPCDKMTVAISLQQYHLINRPESPCRKDYPSKLKKLIMTPQKPQWLYNAMLAPNLPYDRRVCDNLCMVNYWLPICNCVISSDIYSYAGGIDNHSVAQCSLDITENGNKTCVPFFASSLTPITEFAQCKCHKRCDGYSFMVSAYDKHRLRVGNRTIFLSIESSNNY